MPVKYNKSAFSPAVEDLGENWAPELAQYMHFDGFTIEGKVVAYSGCHVLPTAKMPVNAAAELSGGERYSVIASPKMQQKELPRGEGQSRSTCYSSGSITMPNYLESRAGAVAEKEHKIAALVYDKGELYHIEYDEEMGWNYEFVAAVLGDIHTEQLDYPAFKQTLEAMEKKGISEIILHDLLDFQSRNGHERENPLHLARHEGVSVLWEMSRVLRLLDSLADYDVTVVRSNHDDMLDRWLNDLVYKPHLDTTNAKFYHWCQFRRYQAVEEGENPEMLPLVLEYHPDLYMPDNVQFLTLSSSKQLWGVEVANHGHKGVNGASSGLQKLNRPMVVGHSHSAARSGNFVTVGTLALLKQGYNTGGGSSWTQTNAFICKSGRIQLRDVIPA
jgi:hypothetical protein